VPGNRIIAAPLDPDRVGYFERLKHKAATAIFGDNVSFLHHVTNFVDGLNHRIINRIIQHNEFDKFMSTLLMSVPIRSFGPGLCNSSIKLEMAL